jgi:hypothetical protein
VTSRKNTVARRRDLRRAESERRVGRAIDARRGLTTGRVGRAWINGHEVGGEDPRYVHLSKSHD